MLGGKAVSAAPVQEECLTHPVAKLPGQLHQTSAGVPRGKLAVVAISQIANKIRFPLTVGKELGI